MDEQTLSIETEASVQNGKDLDDAHQQVVDWYAAEDMIYWDLDEMRVAKRSSIAQLAKDLDVSRQTIYNWTKTIPNFEQRKKKAREGFVIQNIIAVWNIVFLKACKGDYKSMELYLTNFDPNFVPIRSKFRQSQGASPGLAELLNEVRRKNAA